MSKWIVWSACLLVSLGAGAGAAEAAPPTAAVTTSRGVRELILYPPAGPPGTKDAEAASPPAPAAPAADGKPLVLLVSGEGGWRRFDRMLADWLSEAGYWVGGVDAMDYFWEPQDDRQALASDFRAYAGALAARANRPVDASIVLAGFSFGADLSPWLSGAGGWGKRVHGMLMLGPDKTGSLAFRFSEMLGFEQKDHVFSVADALRDAAGIPVAMIHGEKDPDSDAPELSAQAVEPKRLITVPGADHHFSGHEVQLRAALIEALEWIDARVSTTTP